MTNKMRAVISLFDLSGIISRPYMDAGYVVYQFDQQLESNLYDCNWHIGGDYREWTPIIESIYFQLSESIHGSHHRYASCSRTDWTPVAGQIDRPHTLHPCMAWKLSQIGRIMR